MTHIRSGDVVSLKLFGQQLAAHVRFEERELFATAQDVLSADYLNQTR
jgi:hemerythrin-like domain-containing protein